MRDGGRALVPEGLPPLQLRQAECDLSLGGLPRSEEVVEIGPQLVLRRGGDPTDQCGAQLTVVYRSVGIGHHMRTVPDCGVRPKVSQNRRLLRQSIGPTM